MRKQTRPVIDGPDELQAFLIDKIGLPALLDTVGAEDIDGLSTRVGAMAAVVRMRYRAIVSEDLILAAAKHRAEYMRVYMRQRQADPITGKKIAETQNTKRSTYRTEVREADRKRYAKNKAQVMRKREERRRQDALAELYSIPKPDKDDNG